MTHVHPKNLDTASLCVCTLGKLVHNSMYAFVTEIK
jgi:hypothetical protein